MTVLEELFSNIANAIRTKNSTTDKLKAGTFFTDINNLNFFQKKISITTWPSASVTLTKPNETTITNTANMSGVTNFILDIPGTYIVESRNGSMSKSITIVVEETDKYIIKSDNMFVRGANPANLAIGTTQLGAASVGNYILFGGGINTSNARTNVVEAYNTSLVKSTATELLQAGSYLVGITFGNYAIFAGGYVGGTTYSNSISTYNSSLVRGTATALTTGCSNNAATVVNDKLFIAGGQSSTSKISNVDVYSNTLVKSTATALSSPVYNNAATTVGNYALFAGGNDGTTSKSTVDAYNTSLVKSSATALSTAKDSISGSYNSKYGLIAGGGDTIVDAYSTSLVKSIPSSSAYSKRYQIGITFKDYACILGGFMSGLYFDLFEAWDNALTKIYGDPMTLGRCWPTAAATSNLLLVGGGQCAVGSPPFTNNVDSYTFNTI